jgi:hypothetical protein
MRFQRTKRWSEGGPGYVWDCGRRVNSSSWSPIDRAVVGAVDDQRAVAPARLLVQVGERGERPARRELPGAERDVGLERRAERRPERLDRAAPVGRHHLGELRHPALGVVEEPAGRPRRWRVLVRPGEVAGDGLGGRRPHARELGREARPRPLRRRVDEVGAEARPVRHDRLEQREVEPAQPLARDLDPRRVHRVPRRVAQDVQARRDLEQRRDREPHAPEVLRAESILDHTDAVDFDAVCALNSTTSRQRRR